MQARNVFSNSLYFYQEITQAEKRICSCGGDALANSGCPLFGLRILLRV